MKAFAKSIVIFAAVASGAISAPSALAQKKTYGRPIETPETRMRAGIRAFAHCSMSKDETRVRELLASEIGSTEEVALSKKLQAPARGCVEPSWPNLDAGLVRGALAENMYRREFGRKAFNLPQPAPPLPDTFAVVPADKQGTEAQKNDWYLAGISNCAVFLAPQLAHELLEIPNDVPEEGEALDKMRPAFSQCLGNKPFTLKAGIIRPYIAESMLRWSRRYRASAG